MKNINSKMIMGDVAILIVALIWGATNVVMRDALSGITPFWFCALRFMTAAAAMMLLFGRRALAMSPKQRLSGVFTGAAFSFAYLAGAVGLLYTTAGNQSFIISMSVVFVPLTVWVITRKFPGWHVIAAVVLCCLGMAGLVLDGNMSVNTGDALSFLAMCFVSFYIMLVQRFVKDSDPLGLSCWQAAGCLIFTSVAALFFEPFPVNLSFSVWAAIVYAGTIGFALTLVLQTAAQKYTTSTHTAILLSTSGVFGSLIGVIFIGEPMTWRIFIASALIMAGVLAVEALPLLTKKRPQQTKDVSV